MKIYIYSLTMVIFINISMAVWYSDSQYKWFGLIGAGLLGYILAEWAYMKDKLKKLEKIDKEWAIQREKIDIELRKQLEATLKELDKK